MTVAFVGDSGQIARVYGKGRREQIEARAKVVPGVVGPGEIDERLADVEAIFSTWGMAVLTLAQLDAMPKLRAVFYAAGTVEYFAAPLRGRDILISSAWHANAVFVTEFTVSQILLSCKGYFRNVREYAGGRRGAFRGPGAYGETVALLGAGAVGTKVVEALKPRDLRVIVFDPLMSAGRAAVLGVRKVTIQEAFREGFVVSNHLLDVPPTEGLITRELLASMRPNATFINTGRGKTVEPDALEAVLTERPDITALLDVTEPEPLQGESPLWSLPNVSISTHIAGAIGDEVVLMADYMIEEFDRFIAGIQLKYLV